MVKIIYTCTLGPRFDFYSRKDVTDVREKSNAGKKSYFAAHGWNSDWI